MSLKRILEEEAAIDKEFYGKADDHSEESTAPVVNDEEEVDEYVDEPTAIDFPDATQVTQQEVTTEEPSKPRVSWKQRFTNYKASTDKTISSLRKENSELVRRLMDLETKFDDLASKHASALSKSSDPLDGVITTEDIDTVGEEAVDIIRKVTKRVAESEAHPLKEELARLKAEKMAADKKAQEDRKRNAYNGFLVDLGRIVPDFNAINVDSRFVEFMNSYDEITGEKRVDAFRRAEDYLDADRVADFFLEFKRTVPRSKREVLEENITPTVTSGSTVNTSGKQKVETFTAGQVEKFFNDVARGAYKNRLKEADEMEARITKAYISGNILP